MSAPSPAPCTFGRSCHPPCPPAGPCTSPLQGLSLPADWTASCSHAGALRSRGPANSDAIAASCQLQYGFIRFRSLHMHMQASSDEALYRTASFSPVYPVPSPTLGPQQPAGGACPLSHLDRSFPRRKLGHAAGVEGAGGAALSLLLRSPKGRESERYIAVVALPPIFSRHGGSQGLLYKHLCDSFIN